jgi:hypothetical protein
VRTIRVGAGQVLWAPLPVELAEEIESTAALYRLAMKTAGLEPAIATIADTGVLIYPAMYNGAVLYTLLSETGTGGVVTFTHTAAGATMSAELRAGGASIALVSRTTGQVIADYPRGTTARRPSAD